ncbi:hypothetical protein PT2222_10282 [Paraburkholderia tropica]
MCRRRGAGPPRVCQASARSLPGRLRSSSVAACASAWSAARAASSFAVPSGESGVMAVLQGRNGESVATPRVQDKRDSCGAARARREAAAGGWKGRGKGAEKGAEKGAGGHSRASRARPRSATRER